MLVRFQVLTIIRAIASDIVSELIVDNVIFMSFGWYIYEVCSASANNWIILLSA
jgi:hypothetical protein